MFEEFIKIPLLIYRNYVKQHFGELKFTAEGKTSEAFVQMYGDLLFVAPADITADMIATHSDAQPLYHYVYNHQGPLCMIKCLYHYRSWLSRLYLLCLGWMCSRQLQGCVILMKY